jgi:hypothetical protein
VAAQAIYAVNLGRLPAGAYQLQVLWRGLFLESSKTARFYRCDSVRTARLAFAVRDGKGEAAAGLKDGDFRAGDIPPDWRDGRWQRPVCWYRELDSPGDVDGFPAAGLRVGTFDLVKWLATNPHTLGALPAPAPPKAGQPAYAVVLGPSVNTGEWLTLREVAWRGKQATVHVDLWRDNGPRLQNVRYWPLLIVPLGSAAGQLPAAGAYEVRVAWNLLRAPTNSDPYVAEDTSAGAAGTLAEGLRSRSERTLEVQDKEK